MVRGKPRHSSKYKVLKRYFERCSEIVETSTDQGIVDAYKRHANKVKEQMDAEYVRMIRTQNDL